MGPEAILSLLAWAGIALFLAIIVLAIRRRTRAYAVPTLLVATVLGAMSCVGSLPQNYPSIFFAFFAVGAVAAGSLAIAIAIITKLRGRKHAV